MSEWRRSKLTTRRDKNEPSLMQTMARCGMYFRPYCGPLDGWGFHKGIWVPIEIKAPRGLKTPSQREFIAECEAIGAPYKLWRRDEDVLEFINAA